MVLLASMLSMSVVDAFSATVAAPTEATTSAVYDGLASTPLVRASDSSEILLPSLWRSNTPLGIADEVACVAFLRHFG